MKFKSEELSFQADGSVAILGRQGDPLTLFATAHPDRYSHKTLADIALYRCTVCAEWSREVIQSQGKYICPECAEAIAKAFLLNKQYSGQFIVPTTEPVRPAIHRSVRAFVFTRGQQRCAYCGDAAPTVLDHVIPVSQDGAHTPENLVPACVSCNQKKAARTPEQANMPLQDWAGISSGTTKRDLAKLGSWS